MRFKKIVKNFWDDFCAFFNSEEAIIESFITTTLTIYKKLREVELITRVKKEMEASSDDMKIEQKIRVNIARLKENGVIEKVLLPGSECTRDWYYRMK